MRNGTKQDLIALRHNMTVVNREHAKEWLTEFTRSHSIVDVKDKEAMELAVFLNRMHDGAWLTNDEIVASTSTQWRSFVGALIADRPDAPLSPWDKATSVRGMQLAEIFAEKGIATPEIANEVLKRSGIANSSRSEMDRTVFEDDDWDSSVWKKIVRRFPGSDTQFPVIRELRGNVDQFLNHSDLNRRDYRSSPVSVAFDFAPSLAEERSDAIEDKVVKLMSTENVSRRALSRIWSSFLDAMTSRGDDGLRTATKMGESMIRRRDPNLESDLMLEATYRKVPWVTSHESSEATLESHITNDGGKSEFLPSIKYHMQRIDEEAQSLGKLQPENEFAQHLVTEISEKVTRNVKRIDGTNILTEDLQRGYANFPDYREVGEVITSSRLLKSMIDRPTSSTVTW
jgi:hypothetical protein